MCCPLIPAEEHEQMPEAGPGSGMDRNAFEGMRCCPGFYARSAAAQEAKRAHAWWERGQLQHLYPGGVPGPVAEAVDVCESARQEFRAESARLLALKNKPTT